ncbi:hypothetical protein FHU38_005123 [Saccharomonospora amisosensis]|uniref:DUF2505 domain-containing protein n=1 Tax=Saccharomonospora amisosensis TaxID=1128677 RepID=A0A7X5UVS2_9PSEU|nr:DUF2505 domain-containing protein [Saccharomonospora amisosensis]NIJ14722.1 hypothetical protein [Saccharomonospora amisosensis]
MATRIEHRATFAHSAADVYAAQTQQHALRARLDEIGGKDSTLREHTATADGVSYTLVQGIPAEQLPHLVQKMHSGDLEVQREHTWSAQQGRYVGTVTVHVSAMPGHITARTELYDETSGSVLHTRGEVKVRIPLVGGKLEGFVADQVTELLEHEAEFTSRWLADRG